MNESDDKVIAGRYEVVEKLGRGGQGQTWLARDRQRGERVVIKELRLTRAADWKTVELFEREGEVLEELDHPQIPAYFDAFHVESAEGSAQFFVVHEHVEGETLAERIVSGARFGEEEALDLLEGLLEVLAYLHSRQPPVVHRDVKPANIVLDEQGVPTLIDFGAVQSVLPDREGGSTVVGTTGYLPPEQLMGRAVSASDLYAAGATMVHVLSGRHPADIDMRRNRLQYHELVGVDRPVRDFLDRLLEPAAEDRFDDGAEALDVLRRLRGGDSSQLPVATGEAQGWLSRQKKTVLVGNRATPQLQYDLDCPMPARIDEGIARGQNQVQLRLRPRSLVVEFESRAPISTAIRGLPVAWMVLVVLIMVVPMAMPAKLGLVTLFTGLALVLAYQFFGAERRRLEVEPPAFRLTDGNDTLAEGDLDSLEGFETRGDTLVVCHAGRATPLAAGLDDARAAWLQARLDESIGQLRRHGRLLEVED